MVLHVYNSVNVANYSKEKRMFLAFIRTWYDNYMKNLTFVKWSVPVTHLINFHSMFIALFFGTAKTAKIFTLLNAAAFIFFEISKLLQTECTYIECTWYWKTAGVATVRERHYHTITDVHCLSKGRSFWRANSWSVCSRNTV